MSEIVNPQLNSIIHLIFNLFAFSPEVQIID